MTEDNPNVEQGTTTLSKDNPLTCRIRSVTEVVEAFRERSREASEKEKSVEELKEKAVAKVKSNAEVIKGLDRWSNRGWNEKEQK